MPQLHDCILNAIKEASKYNSTNVLHLYRNECSLDSLSCINSECTVQIGWDGIAYILV